MATSEANNEIHDGKQKTSPVIADSATLQLVSDQFKFAEGPATDKKGNVFFTDQPNNKIWEFDTDGKLSVFMDNAGRSNGMDFDNDGNLISCADENMQLWSIDPKKKVTVLVKDYKGKLLNGPNDVFVTSKGKIYFTDPYYQRDYWKRKSPDLDGQKVYYLKGKNNPVVVCDNMKKPNGIVGTPDGKYLYVADIEGNKTYRFRIEEDGSLSDQVLFADQGSDGMTMDNKGNVYLTGKGVTVYDKEGNKIEHIDVPADWTGNVTFGGKNKNILFITASEKAYTLKMKVKGNK
ncbi:MAG TPA: SMP-30/gluconolactonase/LRE family protein [Hanamia sp.]|nr:SMP-30/gluconolactonase/LRE family protein [Hanamia sp.]